MSTNPRSPSSPRQSSPRQSRRDLGPLVPLHHVAPERLVWLSPGRLAAGKLTLLDGETPPSTGGGLGGEQVSAKAPSSASSPPASPAVSPSPAARAVRPAA